MDPCPFFRIVIGNLAVKFPVSSKPSLTSVPPSSSPCYCKLKLKNFTTQFSELPIISQETTQTDEYTHACFNMNKSVFETLVHKSSSARKPFCLKVEIYKGKQGMNTCGGFSSGKLLGCVSVPLDLKSVENRGRVIQNGWMKVGGGRVELYLSVRVEYDPRFVFQFDGEPECSPQVFQVNGNLRQPVFSCKFSFRNMVDRDFRSRSSISKPSTSKKNWLSSFASNKEQPIKERKGWSITIHDLSGSPVAAASMVTPFVPSPGTDRVSRSNPGAWLILRPGHGTWNPWGRLEAWREHNGSDHLGYRFELLPEGGVDSVTLANSTLSSINGGKFTIDITTGTTPMTSPSTSSDFGSEAGSCSESGSGSWAAHLWYKGFVMSSTVESAGMCSKPEVEIGVQHVACTEDAAAFVALAAAMDLSMDACRLFSHKLRKELRQRDQE